MPAKFNVFLRPQQLNLSSRERALWLQPLQHLLLEHPTRFGQILLGNKVGPWKRSDLREIEVLIAGRVTDRPAQAAYLSILHEAALHWSAHTRKRAPLPLFLSPERSYDNPFSRDFANAACVRNEWISTLSQWVGRLHDVSSEPDTRSLRLAAVLISSIVYGRILGVPILVALVRAIPQWKRKTFIVGRVHIELSLMRKGVADVEHHIWLPDALTGTLWSTLHPNDADELLAPVIRDDKLHSPNDAIVFRRIGALINQLRVGIDPKRLPGIEELRRSAREFAFGEGSPVFVAYDSAELPAESLLRGDVPRLFPGEPLLQFETPPDANPQPVVVDAGDLNALQREPAWIGLLISRTQTNPLRDCLSALASDTSVPKPLRMMADFGIALDSRTPRDGKCMPAGRIMDNVILIARILGLTVDSQDLGALDPVARGTVYLDAINQQPMRTRRDAVQAVKEFDRYLVAKSSDALPINKSSLPWLPQGGSVDPGIITHAEYLRILDRIEAAWPAKRGERQRQLVRLLVMFAFRCGLRRSESRGRRIEDLLILALVAELQVQARKEDPLKTPNAKRRIPIGVLSSNNKERGLDEMQELREWLRMRIKEGAKATDYLFSAKDGKRIPKSLFEELNSFLRKETPYANEGRGVHLHQLRHAAGSWVFVSLMFGVSKNIASLFPQLRETHLWLLQSESLRQHLCGDTTQSMKDPYNIARFCGQGSFDTTASSYINIFPWLVAHELDGIESMRPDAALVHKASGLPDTTFRTWRRAGGLNNIPVRLLVKQGACVANAAFQNQADPRDTQSTHLRIEKNWLMSAREQLVRRGMGESEPNPNATIQAMFARADWLSNCRDSHGHARHPQEWVAGKSDPTTKVSIAAPLMSGRAKGALKSKLLDSIMQMSIKNGKLLSDAVGVFAKIMNEMALFDSIASPNCCLRIGTLASCVVRNLERGSWS